ncbi:hypothetical protein BVRB_5g114950 [Beta vulgaris subsp. vulgaris]|nr:hypothetical protein BVRB_5g114950 [Beta vulgaris subsp. vulgaris]
MSSPLSLSSNNTPSRFKMENQYEYLGFVLNSHPEDLRSTPVSINISSQHFDKFLSSTSMQTRHDIYNGNHSVPAMCDFRGDNGITSRSINLYCDFLCRFTFRDNNNIIENTSLTPRNYISFLRTIPPSNRLSLSIVSAKFVISPLNLFEYHHQIGVDIEVYYRWEESLNSSSKILRLLLHQESIPLLPIEPSTPRSSWRPLGYDVLDPTRIQFNKLEFESCFDVDFALSFPQTIAAMRLRDRFQKGYGIRATNVYTPNKIIHGLQLKMDNFGWPPNVVKLFLGPVLHFNRNFHGKTIIVHYCWIGDCLMLGMEIVNLVSIDKRQNCRNVIK